MQIIWLIIFVILILIELFTINLVTVWFSLSALIVFFISYFTDNFGIEFFIFSLLSFIFLVYTLPITKKYISSSNKLKSQVVILEKREEGYLVRYKGTLWEAISSEDYEVGQKVYIKKFEGNKIII